MSSPKSHMTGMAGEFCALEKLFRLGHEATLTFGNAKSIDILTKSPSGKLYQVSVKAIRGGGKWAIGKQDYSKQNNLVFVLLHFKKFGDVKEQPDIFIIPCRDAEKLKQPWLGGVYAVYCSNKEHREMIEKYRNAWKYLD